MNNVEYLKTETAKDIECGEGIYKGVFLLR